MNFKKLLDHFDPHRKGVVEDKISIISRVIDTAADHAVGRKAVYTETFTEVVGMCIPFSSKHWGREVTEDYADFMLAIPQELTFDAVDDPENDGIRFRGIRYRVVSMRRPDQLLFDDCYFYALRRETGQAGVP